VPKSTNPTTPAPLARPTECRPVGGRANRVPLHEYIQMTFFWQIKFSLKIVFRNISFPCQIPDKNTLNRKAT